jgi:hypothetical protein
LKNDHPVYKYASATHAADFVICYKHTAHLYTEKDFDVVVADASKIIDFEHCVLFKGYDEDKNCIIGHNSFGINMKHIEIPLESIKID